MPNYGDPAYWNKRYIEQGSKMFDWLEGYEALQPFVKKLAPTKKEKILMLGCGNAELSEKMYQDGYENIWNIDISSVVIEQMKKRCETMKNMVWELMDATYMKYEANTFDLVIDKSTIDALLCGDDSFLNVARMTKEVQRVLKVGGSYFIISYGTPENRILHLKRPHLCWEIDSFIIERSSPGSLSPAAHYCYLSRKKEEADEVSKKNWGRVEMELIIEEEKERQLEAQRNGEGWRESKEEGEVSDSDGQEAAEQNMYDDNVIEDPNTDLPEELFPEKIEAATEEGN